MSSTQLDARTRRQVFAGLESRTFDLAVIGGGITGAGIARDAARRATMRAAQAAVARR
jgi:glycerol-3-phosphate dehydrogenase